MQKSTVEMIQCNKYNGYGIQTSKPAGFFTKLGLWIWLPLI